MLFKFFIPRSFTVPLGEHVPQAGNPYSTSSTSARRHKLIRRKATCT